MAKTLVHLITSLEGGGTEHYLFQLLAGSPPGWNHRVLFLKRAGVVADQIRKLDISASRAPRFLALRHFLRQERPDVLHTCLYRAHQLGRFAGHLAGVPRIVSSQQAIDAWAQPWHRYIDRLSLRWADAVIVNSRATEQMILGRRGKAGRPRVEWIENGLDPLPPLPTRDAARTLLGLPSEAIVGAAVMRLHPEKGADFIPLYADGLLTRWPQLHLAVAGVGPLEDTLRRATAGRPWSSRVHWMGWQSPVYPFLAAADFFWSLSREESFPQALLEASAVGLPWVAPDVGGLPELLSGGGVGLLFPAQAIDRAVEETSRLLNDLNSIADRARQARSAVQKHYAVRRMVERTYAVFDGPT
jgi:glycosyltransferase involved in cell wall biosynthesis